MNEQPEKKVYMPHPELNELGGEVRSLASQMLGIMNEKEAKLFDLPSHKRIFLFIFTRALKTFSAIEILCKEGYGQDVASLLRSLMENLITVRYIIMDARKADESARRFVEYKWIIFRRTLAEEELSLRSGTPEEKKDFEEKKKLILDHVQKFKDTYHVQSDRALLTWSGKTLKDMARAISTDLHHEYEKTFRQCSRFSHPTILGDREYMIQDDKNLSFSPQASPIGVETNYISAIYYLLNFLSTYEELFALAFKGQVSEILNRCQSLRQEIDANKQSSTTTSPRPSNIRDVKIFFKY